jgi:hypothetical protein
MCDDDGKVRLTPNVIFCMRNICVILRRNVMYLYSKNLILINFFTVIDVLKPSKRQPMRLEIRHLKRHQKRRARVQHRPIQKLKKIEKTFRIFFALQICFVR